MLRDRLVCGVEEPRIQRRLLAEADLTFDKAYELALASEFADKSAKDLKSATPLVVNRVQHKQECYRCGHKHNAADCRFKNIEYHKCGKKGHIARMCGSKPEPRPSHKLTQHTTHVVIENSEDYAMYNLTGTSDKPLKITVGVDNSELEMEVDTGASVSIISEETYNRIHV